MCELNGPTLPRDWREGADNLNTEVSSLSSHLPFLTVSEGLNNLRGKGSDFQKDLIELSPEAQLPQALGPKAVWLGNAVAASAASESSSAAPSVRRDGEAERSSECSNGQRLTRSTAMALPAQHWSCLSRH